MISDTSELAMLVRRDPDNCMWGAALITAAIVFVQLWVALT